MFSTDAQINGDYSGQSGPLFSLAFKTALLSVMTLGIYRFWAKTRIRKYIWSSINAGGDTFEYTGTGLEKFLGFLVAIVVLAIYLGIIQMILFYFGLNLFVDPQNPAQELAQLAAFYITFIAALPLIYFAQYRARRYKLARSRWRGIRFGAEKGAWGYVWRALGHNILTAITLGLLLPRQTFHLEKYVTDRSWYGDAKFEQNGKWTELYPAMKHIFIGIAIVIAGGVLAGLLNAGVLGVIAIFVGYFWAIIGMVAYRVRSFQYLANNKTLEGGATFQSAPSTSKIVWTVIGGGFMVGLVVGVAFAILGFVSNSVLTPLMLSGQSTVVPIIAIGATYIMVLTVAGALSLAWITQPIIAHYVSTLKVKNASALDRISQREADKGADAEGFADALDVGGAI